MYNVIAFLLGIITGVVCFCVVAKQWYDRIRARENSAKSLCDRVREEQQLASNAQSAAQAQLREEQQLVNNAHATAQAQLNDLNLQAQQLSAQRNELERRIVTYRELEEENAILKRDLQNIDVNLNKQELDGELRDQAQKSLNDRSTQLAKRYLVETVKAIVAALGPSNFSACKQRLLDAIGRCREIGFNIPPDEEARLLTDLRRDFEKEVRLAFQREEQTRIKAQIREEERLKREVERELKQLERERTAIQAALDQALAAAEGQHSAEVERLQARLTEAENKAKHAMSMAQQTRAGHVYVISNIGSFGEGVFKVGLTRRLEPTERIDELGSASVPFPFDVHMMIHCDDAPALENALHRALHKLRVNKANPRKEYFKTTIAAISEIVKQHCGEIEFVADPEALEYRQSLAMAEEDAAFIEAVYDAVEDEEDAAGEAN